MISLKLDSFYRNHPSTGRHAESSQKAYNSGHKVKKTLSSTVERNLEAK